MKAPIVIIAFVSLSLAGCIQSGDSIEISHVHGLAFKPEQGALFIASHHGVARGVQEPGGEDWNWGYVGSERYDFMGFTQDAQEPGIFYSSGHPDDPNAYGGVHLGLRRSLDAGETWEQMSLKGLVDFHALTSIPGQEGWLAGHWQGATKVSTDAGATWTDYPAPPAQVLALAGAPGRLLAGTTAGLYETQDLDSFTNWTAINGENAPAFVSAIAASRDGASLFVSTGNGRAGATYRSMDEGATWSQMSAVPSASATNPVIFAVDPSDDAHVFACTSDGLVAESHDGGGTWQTIRQP